MSMSYNYDVIIIITSYYDCYAVLCIIIAMSYYVVFCLFNVKICIFCSETSSAKHSPLRIITTESLYLVREQLLFLVQENQSTEMRYKNNKDIFISSK